MSSVKVSNQLSKLFQAFKQSGGGDGGVVVMGFLAWLGRGLYTCRDQLNWASNRVFFLHLFTIVHSARYHQNFKIGSDLINFVEVVLGLLA